MADEAEETVKEEAPAKKAPAQKSGGKMFIMAALGVLVIGGAAGAVAARMANGPAAAQAATSAPQAHDEPQAESPKDAASEYYEFDPIVVNLDEPRSARYVRVIVMLELPGDKKSVKEVRELLDARKAKLNNWMVLFWSGCSLDEVRGDRNLKRLQREIMDAFNEQLWPQGKPKIRDVLFKDFNVQ